MPDPSHLALVREALDRLHLSPYPLATVRTDQRFTALERQLGF
jgi:hypothetical protein